MNFDRNLQKKPEVCTKWGRKMERTIRDRIRFIKQVREKHELSTSQIMELCDKNGGYVSDKTIAKILKEGSENLNYQYHSIVSVYEALLNVYGDESTPDDVAALKHIVAERNRQIDTLLLQIETTHEENKQRFDLLEERRRYFEETISLLKAQNEQLHALITEKEKAIEKKDKVLEALLYKLLNLEKG